jgi:threonine dehydratase
MPGLVELPDQIRRAEARIRPHIRETLLAQSPQLGRQGGAAVFCKLENLQHTGSFKVRGALNKLISMTPELLARGVVTASTGNHGAAVAFGLNRLDGSGVIFAPKNASPDKLAAIERLGTEVHFHGDDNADTEVFAREYARQRGMTYISPYNDPEVIAGQGTIAVELARQLEKIDAVFVALGGGGLIAGIASYLKSIHPQVQVVGCSPENSQVMIQSIRAGRILDLPSQPTLSDGTAGGLEPGAITFELCRELVDEYRSVTEEEIQHALIEFMQTEHMLIEGAAAVPIAAYLKTRGAWAGRQVVIIICGANISLDTLRAIL